MSSINTAVAIYENDNYRWLSSSDAIQSLMLKRNPAQLNFRHQYKMLLPLFHIKPKHIVELGLGGGDFQRFITRYLTNTSITSIELAEPVISLFNDYFNPEQKSYNTVQGDAFEHISSFAQGSIDWLIYDLFSLTGENCLASLALYQQLAKKLTDRGWLTLNLPIASEGEIAYQLLLLQQTFGENVWVSQVSGFNNVIVQVSKAPLINLNVDDCLLSDQLPYFSRRANYIKAGFEIASQWLNRQGKCHRAIV